MAKVVVDESISGMKSKLMDRLKERRLRKVTNMKPSPIFSKSSEKELGNIMMTGYEDDSFDYVNVDGTMDES